MTHAQVQANRVSRLKRQRRCIRCARRLENGNPAQLCYPHLEDDREKCRWYRSHKP